MYRSKLLTINHLQSTPPRFHSASSFVPLKWRYRERAFRSKSLGICDLQFLFLASVPFFSRIFVKLPNFEARPDLSSCSLTTIRPLAVASEVRQDRHAYRNDQRLKTQVRRTGT